MIFIIHTPLGSTEQQTYDPLNSILAAHEFEAMVKGQVKKADDGSVGVVHLLKNFEQASADLVERFEYMVLDETTGQMVKQTGVRTIAHWENDEASTSTSTSNLASDLSPTNSPADNSSDSLSSTGS